MMMETAIQLAEKMSAKSGLSDTDWKNLQIRRDLTLSWQWALRHSFFQAIQSEETNPGPGKHFEKTRAEAFGVWLETILTGEPGEMFWLETYMMGLDFAAAGYDGPLLIAMENRVEETFLKRAFESMNPGSANDLYGSFKKIFSTAISVMVGCSSHMACVGMQKIGVNERLFGNIINLAIKSEIEEAWSSISLTDWDETMGGGTSHRGEAPRKLMNILSSLHNGNVSGKKAIR